MHTRDGSEPGPRSAVSALSIGAVLGLLAFPVIQCFAMPDLDTGAGGMTPPQFVLVYMLVGLGVACASVAIEFVQWRKRRSIRRRQ